MKTLVTSLLVALSVATYSTSFAQNGHAAVSSPTLKTQTSVVPIGNGKFDVVVGQTDGNLLIQVVDQQGKTLSSKPVYKDDSNTRIRFNLNELPDGIYELVLTEGATREVKDIVLDTQTTATFRTITLS